MNILPHWQDTVLTQKEDINPPYHALRPGDERVMQYAEKGREFLAVVGEAPYGALSETRSSDLLHVERIGNGYTVFNIPKAAFALKAISLGTGKRRSDLLQAAYTNVGLTIAKLDAAGGAAPELTIDDVAINRRTGRIYMIPPVSFVANGSSGLDSVRHFKESLTELSEIFNTKDIADLRNHVEEGFLS